MSAIAWRLPRFIMTFLPRWRIRLLIAIDAKFSTVAGEAARHVAALMRLLGESLLRLVEISQIRGRLILLGGHQQAVRAEEIVFLADDNVCVAFLAPGFGPLLRLFRNAPVLPVGGPWSRQGIIDHGGEDMNNVRLGLVDKEPLLEDRLIVKGQRQPACVVSARTFEVPRLGLEHVVAAIAVLVDPFADGIAPIG